MRKTIWYGAILHVAFSLLADAALAAPTIQSTSGAWRHKGSVSIMGSNFGTHGDNSPGDASTLAAKFDNFDNGANGNKIENGWDCSPDNTGGGQASWQPRYTTLNQRTGSLLSSYHNFNDPIQECSMRLWREPDWREAYVSYWVRLNITAVGDPQNYKQIRTDTDSGERPGMDFDANWSPGQGNLKAHFCPNLTLSGIDWDCGSYQNYIWSRKEFWYRMGDDPGQRFKFWENAVQLKNYTSPGAFPNGIGAQWGDYGYPTYIALGYWIRYGSAGYVELDDVYLDTTQARVEIGDKSTWEQCTHREIQIPTAWSDTSITVTANQGSFENGKTAYLYVIDANGNVNTQGYPIMFGEAPIADLTPPFVSGQSPAPDAQNVPVNSNVVLHVQDSGDGVDVSSIAVKVNGAAVTPQITGTPSDYTVTYTPASPFAYNSTVTVAVNARDLHSPPNVMTEVAYSFKTVAGDTAPPFVTGQSPAPNAQNVPVNSSVVLHVQDSGDGVERTSIAMTVNGAAVTPQITGTSSDYTVTYAPASPFAYNATVTVTVNARDLHTPPNVMSLVSYSFKTTAGDTAAPVVTGQSPAPNAQNVPVNTSVVLHVQDSGDGVEKASIALTVNGAAVTPQITGTSSDYTVTYAPASPFAYNATVTVTVNARDLHTPPNVMSQVSYSFKTELGDIAAPTVTGQSPGADEQNVLVDSNVVFHVLDSGDGVDIASIQVKVNGVTVTPQITGAPSDYAVTCDPPSPFGYDSVVTVTVNARDLHNPPNVMAEVAYSFKTQSEGAVTEEWGDGSASDHPGTVEDTYINIDAANYAAEDTALNTYTWPANSAANAILMKFNLSAIPQNATVISAKLQLYMYDASTDATYDVSAHKVINVNPVISAATGYTYDGVNTWTPHQGLYDNIPLAQSDIAPAEDTVAVDRTFGYKEWTVTNMVAEWVANPATNRGLLLNSDSSVAADAYRSFRPSEYADAAQRPRLVIGYTVGTPPPLPGPPGKPIHID
ncbi:MAG: Ig-like domain-containing protein [bacterium]|nr:Ig-like domain-containing protein [bacterium]